MSFNKWRTRQTLCRSSKSVTRELLEELLVGKASTARIDISVDDDPPLA
jgi:hypothetical protein